MTTSSPPQPPVKHLIVDSSPLLTSPLSTLRGMATHYLLTPDVVSELRDRKGREVLQEAQLQLLPPEGSGEDVKPGFTVREPSFEAVARITEFARKTGDIAVLSKADIQVLALCLTLELQENGGWRVRDHPGQILTGPPKTNEEHEDKPLEEVEAGVEKLEVKNVMEEPVASTSELSTAKEEAQVGTLEKGEPAGQEPSVQQETDGEIDPQEQDDDENDDEDDGDSEGEESDSSGGSWITPENVTSHKVKDLGLFTPPEDTLAKAPKAIMKAAVLTGDFAMQNVGLQMGLNVLGSGGKRVREVRTWILRCHACFKLCKNPEKRFCPSCGGPTLIRTSITYVPASPEHPNGYILHLKKNFQYRLRGTQYSLPNPKMGRAGGGVNAEPVLREDQKEWSRGIKTAEVMRHKETRALLRSVMDEKRRGGDANEGGLKGFNDPDWQVSLLALSRCRSYVKRAGSDFYFIHSLTQPAMLQGEKGRRRGGKNGAGGEVRLDSSGLPVIGAGRRNPNASKGKRK
ncbi:BZ3500_MvSof-1268-A1-R1_Chr5-3g08151 [Microbotryum saponariae]|uniref:BZ3500_MvSof-1268-A1-R1_Chr5-3g08151 protein n=1 Tax=Microbotryum saponariae TaxID=289078 RepID=A0A2X0LQT4_9BASI|nr:BZ3500_MvSof-1268-A1-R1_Chr5-3g08151 [Microbotryum saponariae]SDA07910.1 BZ3501_MvSof-1269-A2-R1_Chr5-1g07295 [Microbotryum saponariae]